MAGGIGGALRKALPDVALLRRREFRLLWTARTVTGLGTSVTQLALPFQVYDLTQSSLAVGLLGIAQLGPVLVAGLAGGVLADRHDRRAMVLWTEAGLLLNSVMLLVNALLPRPSLALLYVAAAVTATLWSLQQPSMHALVPRLVPVESLTAAAALSWFPHQVAEIIGPASGGLLIAAAGLPAAYGLDIGSFLLSLLALAAMKPVPPLAAEPQPGWRALMEGLRYARSRKDLLGTYLVDLNAMIFGMPKALYPAVAATFGGPAALGVLTAAPAVGSLVVLATSGWTRRVTRHGLAILLAAGVWGLGITLFGLSSALPPALLFLALAGAADTVSGLFRTAMWDRSVPASHRGRLAGVELVSYSAGPALGDLEAGVVASLAGIRAAVVSGGVLCMVGTAVLGIALPALARYDSRDPLPP